MTRPLFEPLSEKHERPDEWSGPLGFVLAGMATYTEQRLRDAALAAEYFNAATALIDALIEKRVADYEIANAALFLYRHCFELLLKSALPTEARANKQTHHLGKLARSYAHYRKIAGKIVPAWVIKRLDELAAIDPSSEAFRYGEYETPLTEEGGALIDEIHVDLIHLKAAMFA